MQDANTPHRTQTAAPDTYLTLTEAAKIAPGRPSTNCLWRWCRKGVLARTGNRVRLQHIRAGGKIFTSEFWVTEFGRRLAEADAQYFDRDDEGQIEPPESLPLRRCRVAHAPSVNPDIERELDEAGL